MYSLKSLSTLALSIEIKRELRSVRDYVADDADILFLKSLCAEAYIGKFSTQQLKDYQKRFARTINAIDSKHEVANPLAKYLIKKRIFELRSKPLRIEIQRELTLHPNKDDINECKAFLRSLTKSMNMNDCQAHYQRRFARILYALSVADEQINQLAMEMISAKLEALENPSAQLTRSIDATTHIAQHCDLESVRLWRGTSRFFRKALAHDYQEKFSLSIRAGIGVSILFSNRRCFTAGYKQMWAMLGKYVFALDFTMDFCLKYENESYTNIAVGGGFLVFLTSFGRVIVWGKNYLGQIGQGEVVHQSNAIELNMRDYLNHDEEVVLIACGNSHTILSTNQCRLIVTGENSFGQLGLGNCQHRSEFAVFGFRPYLKKNEYIKDIQCGVECSLLLTSQNRLFSWGYLAVFNNNLNSHSYPSSPTEHFAIYDLLKKDEVISLICCDGFHAFICTSQQRVFAWGVNENGCILPNQTSVLRGPREIRLNIKVDQGERIINIRTSTSVFLVWTNWNRVIIWGKNDNGRLGFGNIGPNEHTPTELPINLLLKKGESIADIQCSEHVILSTTYHRVFVWGMNDQGQLGLGDCIDRHSPTELDLPFVQEQFEEVSNSKCLQQRPKL